LRSARISLAFQDFRQAPSCRAIVLRGRELIEAGLPDLADGGPVNLPNGGHAKTGCCPLAFRGDAWFGDLAPHDDRAGTKRSIAG
jgi:hypothetical protein